MGTHEGSQGGKKRERRVAGGPQGGWDSRSARVLGGAQKSGAVKAPALPAPARDSRPHFPLLPAPSLQ